MFEGERGEMRVGNEVGAPGRVGEQAGQNLAMALRRRRHPDRLTVQPALDLVPRRRDRRGPLEDPWIGHDAQEGRDALPRKPDLRRPVQLCVEPVACGSVLRKLGDPRVDEQVRVDQDQR